MNKQIFWIIVLVIVAAGAYYVISPLFNTIEVNDELPGSSASSGLEHLSQEQQEDMFSLMREVNQKETAEMEDGMPTGGDTAPSPTTATVMGTTGHPASGVVHVVDTADGQVIRYEDFQTINGPRLHVYLAKDLEAREFIDLGPIRGTKGNINYEVPEGTDLSEYRYVMYWCVPFGVLFNYADIGK